MLLSVGIGVGGESGEARSRVGDRTAGLAWWGRPPAAAGGRRGSTPTGGDAGARGRLETSRGGLPPETPARAIFRGAGTTGGVNFSNHSARGCEQTSLSATGEMSPLWSVVRSVPWRTSGHSAEGGRRRRRGSRGAWVARSGSWKGGRMPRAPGGRASLDREGLQPSLCVPKWPSKTSFG